LRRVVAAVTTRDAGRGNGCGYKSKRQQLQAAASSSSAPARKPTHRHAVAGAAPHRWAGSPGGMLGDAEAAQVVAAVVKVPRLGRLVPQAALFKR
jgi:hypothetical protein